VEAAVVLVLVAPLLLAALVGVPPPFVVVVPEPPVVAPLVVVIDAVDGVPWVLVVGAFVPLDEGSPQPVRAPPRAIRVKAIRGFTPRGS